MLCIQICQIIPDMSCLRKWFSHMPYLTSDQLVTFLSIVDPLLFRLRQGSVSNDFASEIKWGNILLKMVRHCSLCLFSEKCSIWPNLWPKTKPNDVEIILESDLKIVFLNVSTLRGIAVTSDVIFGQILKCLQRLLILVSHTLHRAQTMFRTTSWAVLIGEKQRLCLLWKTYFLLNEALLTETQVFGFCYESWR